MQNELMNRYPVQCSCKGEIEEAANAWIACYEAGGKLMACGNDGSCAATEEHFYSA